MIVITMVNFRTLDLNLLRAFDALAATRNVTRAAERLGLSQPAVSAALSRLREHLADPLFVRVGNGMVPTDRAAQLQPVVAAALASLNNALTEPLPFDPATAEVTFTLRGADFFSMRLMPVLAARIARDAPGVSLRFLDSARGELVDLLEHDEIDIALEQPTETPGWVSRAPLFPSPFKVVAAKGNPAIVRKGIQPGSALTLDLFCELPHAMRSIDGSMSGMADAALALSGKRRRVALVLPHFDAIMEAVSQSNMIATVPEQLADDTAERKGLAVFDPPIDIPVPTMRMYWHSRHDDAPAHSWLRRSVLEEIARLWGNDASFD